MPIEEQTFPIVTITSCQGDKTLFCFTSAATYQDFLVWATWSPLNEGYTISITKEPTFNFDDWVRKRSDAETKRHSQMLKCFQSYNNDLFSQ